MIKETEAGVFADLNMEEMKVSNESRNNFNEKALSNETDNA